MPDARPATDDAWIAELLEDELDRDDLIELARLQVELLKLHDEKRARLQSIRHVLNALDFRGRGQPGLGLAPDPSVVARATAGDAGDEPPRNGGH